MIKGIYVHVPFCIKKCSFCDFSIHAIGTINYSHNLNLINQYTSVLIKEIDHYFSKDENKHSVINSIYFGGGTPTLLPKGNIELIIKTINKYLTNTPKEVSIESDPSTFCSRDLEIFENLGFNRITMGVQTLDEGIHQSLNRSHTIKDVYNSLDIIRNSKILSNNFGVDLIQGLPNQTVSSAIYDIDYLSKIVKHISIYSLTLEKNSSLYRTFKGEYKTKEYQDQQAEMFLQTHNLLISNKIYNHYEISNYALNSNYKDHKSVHNQLYWNFDNYKGFGLSSSSKIGKFLYKNPISFKKYFEYVDKLDITTNTLEYLEVEELNYIQYYKYLLINSFRLFNGTNMKEIEFKLSQEYPLETVNINDLINKSIEYFNYITKSNKYEGLYFDDYRLEFKTPEVFMLSDEILIELLIYLSI